MKRMRAAEPEEGSRRLCHLGQSAEVGRRLLAQLTPDASTHIDDLLEKTENCSSSEIIAALFELEMMGLVRQLPGRNYIKVW